MECSLSCIIARFFLIIFYVSDFYFSPLCSLWEQDSSLCAVYLAVGMSSWRCSSCNSFLLCRRLKAVVTDDLGVPKQLQRIIQVIAVGPYGTGWRVLADFAQRLFPCEDHLCLIHPVSFLVAKPPLEPIPYCWDSLSESNFHLGTEFLMPVSIFPLQAKAQHLKHVLISSPLSPLCLLAVNFFLVPAVHILALVWYCLVHPHACNQQTVSRASVFTMEGFWSWHLCGTHAMQLGTLLQ